ncbi:MAG: flippase-like domain-containing protein [Caldilineaceae bacterium]|nr:flippase-like domain-containing protein [Caldilineaceae bacterium]
MTKDFSQGNGRAKRRHRPFLSTTLYLIVAFLLLWLTLRQVTLVALWQVFAQLQGSRLLMLLLLNGVVVATMVIRWQLLLHALGYQIPWLALLRYRLAAFGVTYFTPGPQFGGEPLQVYLVHERHQVPLQDAIAAVTLDKVLEMLVKFGFLACGVTLLISRGMLTGMLAYSGLALALLLLAIPLLLFFTFLRGKRPLQTLAHWIDRRYPTEAVAQQTWWQRVLIFVAESEAQAIQLCQGQPRPLFGALAVTLIGWGFMVAEFGYAAHALGASFTFLEILLAMIAARVAYLLPMPAGIGTFESALALAFHWLHQDPAGGLALSLLIRGRDVLLGAIGLWLGRVAFHGRRQSGGR